jgi:beta-galactosidase
VHLVVTEDAHIPDWGTYIVTSELVDDYAKVQQKTELCVPHGKSFTDYRIETTLLDQEGRAVAVDYRQGTKYDAGVFTQDFIIDNPAVWTPEEPNIYTSKTKIYEGDILKDEVLSTFGVRTIEIRPDEGFFLNGQKTVFKGVCNHHDLGPLGAIANEAGIRRQVRMLKDMGCNAIRTSHNMPAPELVKACDEMGMMLMAETFDCWVTPKVQNGYNLYFEEWAEKDLVNLIRHYRNSPAVVMWCVGNEVPDQWPGDKGAKIALWLQQICHREDPTRPVTMGMDQPGTVINNNVAAVFDRADLAMFENKKELKSR